MVNEGCFKNKKEEEGGKEGYKGMYIGRQKGKLSANINKNVIEVYNSFEISVASIYSLLPQPQNSKIVLCNN